MAEEAKAPEKAAAKDNGNTPEGTPKIRWDDSNMTSSYANVCNVTSTREEVVLFFGMNQNWHAAQDEVTIKLTDRVIMNPHAARRLMALLGNVLREYENRFGALTESRPNA